MERLEAELGAIGLDTAMKCAELREGLIRQWENDHDRPNQFLTIVEHRFWYRAGTVPRFSGQADFIRLNRAARRALIVDYKTGRLEAEPAADNMQLRAEVVILKQIVPELEEIQAAIDEPLVSWDSERVNYSGDAFRQAEEEILSIVDEATFHPEHRRAGPWCTNCPARIYCREAIDYREGALAIRYGTDIEELPRGPRGVELWEKIIAVIKLFKDVRSNYELILREDPDALPGYTLPEEGHEHRGVVSPAALKKAVAAYLTADEVDACAEYYLGKVEEKFGAKAGLKGLKRKRSFAELVADVIEITHDKPFIRPLTKKERQTKELTKPNP
jgi:hypothetical protein